MKITLKIVTEKFCCLFFIVAGIILVLQISACNSYESITKPLEGTASEKISRFEYMESNWSYLNNRWIKGDRVSPEKLAISYGIPEGQAQAEIKEFVESQYKYNVFHRFLISLYLDNVTFYTKN